MGKTAGSDNSSRKREKAKGKAPVQSRAGGGRKIKSTEERIKEVDTKRQSIKAFFERAGFEELAPIEHLFTKAMADQLGVNHGRFIDKLKHPVRFSVKEIYRFSYYAGIEPAAMLAQVGREVDRNRQVVAELKKVKPLADKKKVGQ